jgi:glutathione S-transferase
MARPLLLTVPFSHFCEKARWALDYAGVDYVEEGHIPGFHRLAVGRTKSPNSSVPVLVTDDETLGDSSDILAWADAKAPVGQELYPKDEAARREVLALEDELDEELGPHIRRVLYFYILGERRLAFGLMDQQTPGWERAALRVGSPFLFFGMRRFMTIERSTAEDSRDRVFRLFDAMDARLKDGRRYLVGDRFTAADLTLASLAGPSVMPPEHPVRFPRMEDLPPAASAIFREVRQRPVAEYLTRMYARHRQATASAA